jgi:hypothetical protein
MPRHLPFVVGFAATCAVIVPLAWHPLDASIEKDGKKLRPLQQEFTTSDGTRVTLDVDRGLAMVGDTVTATLRAYSETSQHIAVDVRVWYTPDTWGGRVSPPAKSIDVEHLTLTAAPDGGKPVQTRIRLAGDGKINTYRIFVAPRGKEISVDGEDAGDEVAAVSLQAWAGNDFAMSIRPESKILPGEPFTMAVRIRNTSNRTYKRAPYVHLGTSLGLYGISETDDTKISELDDDDERSLDQRRFRPGDSVLQRFTVTPASSDQKEITFVASAYVWQEEPGPIVAGAMDATTIALPQAGAKLASK